MARDAIRIVSLFLPTEPRGPEWRPAADVLRTDTGWLVKFELPGVRPEDVHLIASGRHLTVRGMRRDCCPGGPPCHHYQLEIDYGTFERTVDLPESLDRSRIAVEHWHGLLLVRIDTEAFA